MIWALLLSICGTRPPDTRACYCAMKSLGDDVRAATHVVVGRVLRLRTVATLDRQSMEEHEAVLVVEASWKGATAGDTLTVWDPFSRADCSAGFVEGQQNLVFARPEGSRLVAIGCWRSRPARFAEGALDSLGPPRAGRWHPE
jgi:hypothetical protein